MSTSSKGISNSKRELRIAGNQKVSWFLTFSKSSDCLRCQNFETSFGQFWVNSSTILGQSDTNWIYFLGKIYQADVRQPSCINLSFYFKGFGNQKRLDAHMTNGDCPGKPNPKWHYTNMTAKRLFCIHPECLGPNGFDINYLENSFNSGKIVFDRLRM